MQDRHEAVLTTRGDTTPISSVDSRKAKSSSIYIVYRVIISVGNEKWRACYYFWGEFAAFHTSILKLLKIFQVLFTAIFFSNFLGRLRNTGAGSQQIHWAWVQALSPCSSHTRYMLQRLIIYTRDKFHSVSNQSSSLPSPPKPLNHERVVPLCVGCNIKADCFTF